MTTIGQYALQDRLGIGGMGIVYRGIDNHTGQTVAIKQLKSEIANPEIIERFRREGEALRDLNHPNIVKMLDMFEHEAHHYLVMDYISGSDLNDFIKQNSPLDYGQCINIAIDVADALTRAHRLNIIHRDLKPANILISDDGIVQLTDFGVAHIADKERLTDHDAVTGSLEYLSPEALHGNPASVHSDIWGFGILLLEMLLGKYPFQHENLAQIFIAITQGDLPDLEALRPDIPISLIDLIYRMLERDPQARIPSVRIVGAELEAILENRDYTPQPSRFESDIQDVYELPKHNLPAQTTAFVGREQELELLDSLLHDPNIRLITILAQGGMGKTRLSLELAERALNQNLYVDGVYFVELAPLSDASNIPNIIGEACGFQFLGGGTIKEQLLSLLKERNLLLILDNYEHLPEGFSLVSDILKSASNVHVITTSRQRLSQEGETLFHLTGMDFPELASIEDALDFSTIKLFMNSAKRVHPAFDITQDNLPYIMEVCRLVQGMPLGIILAASWLTILSISEIIEEIQSGLDFLQTEETDLPERHRNIRTIMDYSWEQMSEAEQQIFMKLSVFRGGFTREAGQAIAGANLRNLRSLVSKSLIQRNANSGRYEIHELLRQYAEKHLTQSSELEATNKAHMKFFADFMGQSAIDIKGRQQVEGLNNIEADFDNLQIAWQNASEPVNYNTLDKMMEALALYFDMRAMYKVGEDLFESALRKSNAITNKNNLIHNRLNARFIQVWNLQERIPIADHVAELTELTLRNAIELKDIETIMLCNWFKGEFHRFSGEGESSLEYYDIALKLCRENNLKYYEARLLRAISFTYSFQNDKPFSTDVYDEFRQVVLQLQDHNSKAHSYLYEGWRLLQSRKMDISESESLFKQADSIWQSTKDIKSMGTVKYMLGRIYFDYGRFEDAESQMINSLMIHERINYLRNQPTIFATLSMIYSINQQYDKAYKFLNKAVKSNRTQEVNAYIYTSVALYYVSRHQYKHALPNLLNIVNTIQKLPSSEIIRSIPLWALYIKHEGKTNKSIEFLGLVFSHPTIPNGWMKKWDLFTQLKADLKSKVGDEAYAKAWERGKLLDLETVIQDLIDEFSNEST